MTLAIAGFVSQDMLTDPFFPNPLEEALAAMGVVVWPMIELEADDALASAAHLAGACMGSLETCLTNDWRARELLRNLRLDPNDPFRLVSSPGCPFNLFPSLPAALWLLCSRFMRARSAALIAMEFRRRRLTSA